MTRVGGLVGALAGALAVAACGAGDQEPSVDAAPDRTPAEIADDTAPYELPADCAGLPAWDLGAQRHPDRVAAASSVSTSCESLLSLRRFSLALT